MPERDDPQPAAADAVRVEAVTHRYGGRRAVTVLQDVSFAMPAGTTLALVGESGAGKSTLSRLLAGLEQPSAGRVLIAGRPHALKARRASKVQMVFQNPFDALNPFQSVGASLDEALRHVPRRKRNARRAELLELVGVDPARAADRPRAFSGGQLQRVGIARALAAEPELLLCDEPTSALDVSVQAQVVNLLLRLQRERGFACVLVTHDLGIAKVLADTVLVLKDGRVVEHTPAPEFFAEPRDPYSRELLAATAEQMLDADVHARLEQPLPIIAPEGHGANVSRA